jgi:hypothetical protein
MVGAGEVLGHALPGEHPQIASEALQEHVKTGGSTFAPPLLFLPETAQARAPRLRSKNIAIWSSDFRRCSGSRADFSSAKIKDYISRPGEIDPHPKNWSAEGPKGVFKEDFSF